MDICLSNFKSVSTNSYCFLTAKVSLGFGERSVVQQDMSRGTRGEGHYTSLHMVAMATTVPAAIIFSVWDFSTKLTKAINFISDSVFE